MRSLSKCRNGSETTSTVSSTGPHGMNSISSWPNIKLTREACSIRFCSIKSAVNGDLNRKNKTMDEPQKYPETYLHITECSTGDEHIMEISGNKTLDLELRIKEWLKREYCGEVILDGELMPKLDGQYYAKIMTNGRPPDSVVCWEDAGFFTKVVTYNYD